MIKKVAPQTSGTIKKTEPSDELLRFSFKYFIHDHEVCPKEFADGYTGKLLERLRDLSSWTIKQFTGASTKSVRNHRITWPDTSRPDGFDHLPEQLREGEAWQFSVSVNEHGRVHGLLIGNVFNIVWLDSQHALYPQS